MTSVGFQITPKLRFSDYSYDWNEKMLSDVFKEITNCVGKQNIETYSITAGKGFVSQTEKFGRNISGRQNSKYTVLEPGDFSYNKGNSKTYKYGCVYLNNESKQIAVPNVFISFNLIDPQADKLFFAKLFESHYLDRGLRKIISSTARMDGLLNVNKKHFFTLKICFPRFEEQKRIADFLGSVDNWIENLKTQKELLENYKKDMVYKIFSRNISFRSKNGKKFSEWESNKLNNILFEHKSRNSDNKYSEVFSVAKEKGVINQIEHLGRSYASKNLSNYKIIFPNDIVYTKSPTANFPYGIIKQNLIDRTGLVSTLYAVYKPENKYIGKLLHFYFLSWKNTFNYLNPLVQKGAKNTLNINNDDFLNGVKFLLPTSIEEQCLIVNFLDSIDNLLVSKHHQIVQAENWKKGLMQGLFV